MGEIRSAYSILVEKPEAKRLFGRTRRRRKYNIRTGLSEAR
jgi:hypothetical protein